MPSSGSPNAHIPRIIRAMRLLYAILLMLLAGLVHADDLVLVKEEDRYTLHATSVPLSAVLQRIEVIEGVTIRHFGASDRLISATYRDVALDQLLARLRVSYALVYEADDMGRYRLGDAIMMRHGQPDLAPETRATVMRLIRDLSDDTVYYNAHAASFELQRMGCDILPLLEEALHVNDYQGRHLAANILRRMKCPDYVPSDILLDVTLQLLGRDPYDPDQYWSLFSPSGAFEYLHALGDDVYRRVRRPLIRNLTNGDPQERLLSAALLAERGEQAVAPRLVSLLAPHLADNDLPNDAGMAAHALYKLGSSALPHLSSYRRSSDRQQAELADLIYTAVESGELPDFAPIMYIGSSLNPLVHRQSPGTFGWHFDRFPDASGKYHTLREPRRTAADYYGRITDE